MTNAESVELAALRAGRRFEPIEALSQAGQSTNEDRARASTRAAWILDGATGLRPAAPVSGAERSGLAGRNR